MFLNSTIILVYVLDNWDRNLLMSNATSTVILLTPEDQNLDDIVTRLHQECHFNVIGIEEPRLVWEAIEAKQAKLVRNSLEHFRVGERNG